MEGLSLIFLIVAIVCFILSAVEGMGQQPGRFKIDLTAAGLAFFAAAFIP